jgi:hypothetical protein
MGYVIAACINGINHCVKANEQTNSFELVPVKFDSDISKVFCHPNKTGAMNILHWIKAHDKKLARKELAVYPQAKFIS